MKQLDSAKFVANHWTLVYTSTAFRALLPSANSTVMAVWRAVTIFRGLSHPTGLAALLSDNISFFKGGETL